MCSYYTSGAVHGYMNLAVFTHERVSCVGVRQISRMFKTGGQKLSKRCPISCQVGECMIEVEVHIKRTVPQLMPAAWLHKVSL